MKTSSIQAFRCSWLVIGFALGACGGDDPSMQNPATGAGMGGSIAAAGGGAGTVAPAAGRSGASGTGAAGSTVAGSTGGAGRAAAGSPAAGSSMMPGGAGGGTAGAAAGASGGAAGAAAGSGGGAAAGSGGTGAAGASAGAGGMAGGGATFTQVYGLIMMGCSCHVTGTQGGLSMSSKMAAYTNLVGMNSTACTGQKRVVASDPANSVLFHSIDRTNLGSCMVPQMPRGMAKWSAANIDTVKAWIMAGALNN